jgi:hypothetical protein
MRLKGFVDSWARSDWTLSRVRGGGARTAMCMRRSAVLVGGVVMVSASSLDEISLGVQKILPNCQF